MLEFPVHLRYHAASDSLKTRTIDFKPPEVFVSCTNNDTVIFSDKNCQRFARKVGICLTLFDANYIYILDSLLMWFFKI